MTRPIHRPGFRSIAASLMMSAVAFGVTLSAASAETIRWARVGDALTLDPHSANEGPTSTLLHHIYETLVSRGLDGSLQPRLATEWSIHPDDPTVWVFKLRQGVKFHDGTPFDAAAMVFSLHRFLDFGTLSYQLSDRVSAIRAVDSHTLELTLKRPFAPLAQLLSSIVLTPGRT